MPKYIVKFMIRGTAAIKCANKAVAGEEVSDSIVSAFDDHQWSDIEMDYCETGDPKVVKKGEEMGRDFA